MKKPSQRFQVHELAGYKSTGYEIGLDALGGERLGGGGGNPDLAWWESLAVVVGALASLATLIEISLRWKDGKR